MAKDTSPATKADLELLKKELKRYFDVSVENLAKEFRGAFSDRVEWLNDARTDHEQRISRLERRAGIV